MGISAINGMVINHGEWILTNQSSPLLVITFALANRVEKANRMALFGEFYIIN